MKIDKVTITNNELNEAVEMWIKTKGINVPVERVQKASSYSSEWTVDFVDQNPPASPPAVENTDSSEWTVDFVDQNPPASPPAVENTEEKKG